ncbi:MAG TPA: PQQ-dependent sugar dehydrogenase [Vicinamibacterales bacterium]
MLPPRQLATALLVVLAAGAACDDRDLPPLPPSPPASSGGDIFTAQDGTRFGVETVVSNVEIPWSLAFAPDGRLFFTERPGRVRVVQNGQLLPDPMLVLTDVAAVGESGALGLAVHPQFADNHFVYLAYTAMRPDGSRENRIVRYREVGNTLGEPAVILDGINAADIHDGARLRFGPDGRLYVTMGDVASPPVAQDLASFNGKLLRLNDDGSVPADNPFSSHVLSYGHRNPQGLDWHPVSGELWATEHGQEGNDELNRIVAGANYGWPEIEANQTRPGMEPPVLYFTPAVAPSGASFYTGAAIPGFRNDLFIATLRGQHLHRVRFDPANPERIIATERLLLERFGRIRDVVTGPDGALYFCTSNRDGRADPSPEDDRILRIVAR